MTWCCFYCCLQVLILLLTAQLTAMSGKPNGHNVTDAAAWIAVVNSGTKNALEIPQARQFAGLLADFEVCKEQYTSLLVCPAGVDEYAAGKAIYKLGRVYAFLARVNSRALLKNDQVMTFVTNSFSEPGDTQNYFLRGIIRALGREYPKKGGVLVAPIRQCNDPSGAFVLSVNIGEPWSSRIKCLECCYDLLGGALGSTRFGSLLKAEVEKNCYFVDYTSLTTGSSLFATAIISRLKVPVIEMLKHAHPVYIHKKGRSDEYPLYHILCGYGPRDELEIISFFPPAPLNSMPIKKVTPFLNAFFENGMSAYLPNYKCKRAQEIVPKMSLGELDFQFSCSKDEKLSPHDYAVKMEWPEVVRAIEERQKQPVLLARFYLAMQGRGAVKASGASK